MTGPDRQNPVQRTDNTRQGGSLRPETVPREKVGFNEQTGEQIWADKPAPTHTGPFIHGAEHTWHARPGQTEPSRLDLMIDPSLAQGSLNYPPTGGQVPVGVTPYQNVMQTM